MSNTRPWLWLILSIMLGYSLGRMNLSEPTPAYAQGIPDGGAQRAAIIEQLKILNTQVAQTQQLLISGKVKVTVEQPSQSRDED